MLAISVVALVLSGLSERAEAQPASERCTDDLLSELAAELLLSGGEPSGAELLAAARRAGEGAPTVHALAIRDGNTARSRTWLRRLEARLRAPIACGAAASDRRVLVIAAPRGGRLDRDPNLDRRFHVSLSQGFSEPIVYVEDGRGALEHLLPDEDGVVDVPADLREPIHVQLVARGTDGPRPIAEHTIGAIADASIPTTDADDPFDARIAELRTRAAIPALRPHRLLASLAREHAEAVCRERRAAHELEPGRDPRARARSGGIDARHLAEVVARAPSRDAAFAALIRSPSHRSALLDRRMTDAGAGAATDVQGRTCIVVLLASWPRLIAGSP